MLKSELIEALTEIRRHLCCYCGGDNFCDCKYLMGTVSDFIGRGEKTGCCEIRLVIQLLSKMKASEFNNLMKRSGYLANRSLRKINPSAYRRAKREKKALASEVKC